MDRQLLLQVANAASCVRNASCRAPRRETVVLRAAKAPPPALSSQLRSLGRANPKDEAEGPAGKVSQNGRFFTARAIAPARYFVYASAGASIPGSRGHRSDIRNRYSSISNTWFSSLPLRGLAEAPRRNAIVRGQ